MRIKTALLTITAALLVYAAQPVVPDTPAGRQLSAWLDAFNGGDRAKLQAFLETRFPSRAQNVTQELGFRERTGGFELEKIEESTPTRIAGLVKERGSDQFARFTMDVEAAEPHHITGMGIRAIPRPPDFPIERLSETQLTSALRTKLDQETAADRFAGAVMVTKNGKVVFSGAYGLADREKKFPNQLKTKFRIGSMNKMFTAASIMQLTQAGKINVSDPLGKYLTDYPNKDIAAKVTIHELLTHTGGTGDIFGPQFNEHRLELRSLQDYVKLYGKRDLAFEPGSRWVYSNYGFLLLGLVIEKVTGGSYYDYVRDHIFKPAGMASSGSQPEDEAVAGRSAGYTKMGGQGGSWRDNKDTLPYRGTSAGGGYSTVDDLVKFGNALLSHKLLDQKHTDLLTTGKVDTMGGGRYAYGFADTPAGGARSFGHGGGAPGMNGDLQIFPQSGYVVAVLSNLDPPAANRISEFIGQRLPMH